jgi:hypothetical protein
MRRSVPILAAADLDTLLRRAARLLPVTALAAAFLAGGVVAVGSQHVPLAHPPRSDLAHGSGGAHQVFAAHASVPSAHASVPSAHASVSSAHASVSSAHASVPSAHGSVPSAHGSGETHYVSETPAKRQRHVPETSANKRRKIPETSANKRRKIPETSANKRRQIVAPPVGSPSQRALARVSPALALVETTFTARLSVPAPELDQNALGALESSLANQVATGQVGSDQASVQHALASAIEASPLSYLVPTQVVQNASVQIQEVGTAWEVAPDGWLVAPAVTVRPPAADLKAAFEQAALASLARQEAQELASGPGGVTDPASLSALVDAATKYNFHYVQMGRASAQTTVQWGEAIVGMSQGRQGRPAKVVRLTGPFRRGQALVSGLALLHVAGVEDMATMALEMRGSHQASRGTRLLEAGYDPPSAYFDDTAATETIADTVRITAGTGQSFAFGSAPADPTAPAGRGGNALVDTHGDLAGILTYPAPGPPGFQTTTPLYALGTNAVSGLLRSAHLREAPSPTDALYRRAFGLWFAHDYKAALPAFEHIEDLAPDDPTARRYAAEATSLIAAGMDRTPVSIWTVLLACLFVLAALRLVGFPLIRHLRRGYRHARVSARWANHPASGPPRPVRGDPFSSRGNDPLDSDWIKALEETAKEDSSAGIETIGLREEPAASKVDELGLREEPAASKVDELGLREEAHSAASCAMEG